MAHTAGHRRAQMVNRQNAIKSKARRKRATDKKRIQEKNRINRTIATSRKRAMTTRMRR